MEKGRIIILSGFSGVGKGTVVKSLLSRYDDYMLSVSMTTRNPRPGEKEGVDYYYVSDEQFEAMIKEDGFLEHAGYVQHYYGSPKKPVIDGINEGKNVILEIEVQGALQIKEKYPDSLMIFVIPPKAEELKARLMGRGTETEEEINKRLLRAVEESKQMPHYEYFVVNDIVEECADRIDSIVRNLPEPDADKEEIVAKMQKDIETFI